MVIININCMVAQWLGLLRPGSSPGCGNLKQNGTFLLGVRMFSPSMNGFYPGTPASSWRPVQDVPCLRQRVAGMGSAAP